jgi:hypothetical protein
MNAPEGSGSLRPSHTAWLVLFRNVVLAGLVTTSLWLLLVWLGVLLTGGWQAATTGIDSGGDLGGTFVYWLLITAPVFALGGLLYEATLYLLSRGSDAWEGWARRVLLAPLILVPVGLTGPGLKFLVAPGFCIPALLAAGLYGLLLHRPVSRAR